MTQFLKILVNTPHSGFRAYSIKKVYVYIILALNVCLAVLGVLTFTAFWYQKNRVRSLETELSLIQTAQNAGIGSRSESPLSTHTEDESPLEDLVPEAVDPATKLMEKNVAQMDKELAPKQVLGATSSGNKIIPTPSPTEAFAPKAPGDNAKISNPLPGTRQYFNSLWQEINLLNETNTLKSSPLQIKVLKLFSQKKQAHISLSISAKHPEAETYKGYLMYLWQTANSLNFEPKNIFWEHNQLLWDYRLGQSYTIKRVKLVNLEFPLPSNESQPVSLLIIGFDNLGKIHYFEKKDWKSFPKFEKN